MRELKPCPFCGCEGAGTQWHHGYWSVSCGYNPDATLDNCFQDWGKFKTEEQAIEAWNTRTNNEYDDLIVDLYKVLSQICDCVKKHDLSFARVTGVGAPERVAPVLYSLGRIDDKYDRKIREVFNRSRYNNKN